MDNKHRGENNIVKEKIGHLTTIINCKKTDLSIKLKYQMRQLQLKTYESKVFY